MVRYSKAVIAQILTLLTVIWVMSYYYKLDNDEANGDLLELSKDRHTSKRLQQEELILHVKDRAPEITETQTQNTDRETQIQHTQNHPGSSEGDQDLEEDLKPESAEVKTEPKPVGEKEHQENNAISLPQAAEERIAERMARIGDVCQRLNYPSANQFNLYYFHKYGVSHQGVTWCPTFKASSSTWRDFFIDDYLGQHVSFHGTHYHLAVLGNQLLRSGTRRRGASGEKTRMFIKESVESVRFTVVRHPISRLISHVRKATNYPYEIAAQRDDWVEESIIHSRTDPDWDSGTRNTFKGEWDKYIDEIRTNRPHAPHSANNPYLDPPYPRFSEMVDFIIRHRDKDGKGNNGHWRPTNEWCDICQNNFDYIIQLENEPEELLFLLEKLGLLDYKDRFMSKHNSSNDKSASRNEITDYLKQLNHQQKVYLNEMFAVDFEMFGYDPIPQ